MAVEALEITVTAPVASFRNPLYHGVQVGLPCPPPSTVGGLLAAAAGGWEHVPVRTRFAMVFHAAGHGTDLETYHPIVPGTVQPPTTIKERDFLAFTNLTLWLTEDLDLWENAIRRPVWLLRLGRSQDLAAARTERTALSERPGAQGHAVVPADQTGSGSLLQLPTALSADRQRTIWDTYRYAANGSPATLETGLRTDSGQAVVLLSPVHPAQLAA
ncbi:CRISPR-associated protein Cas5 [Kitasatospora sp. NPDC054768]